MRDPGHVTQLTRTSVSSPVNRGEEHLRPRPRGEGEVRADLCRRTRRLLSRSVPGSAQGDSRLTPPGLQLPSWLHHHGRLLALHQAASVSGVHGQSASAHHFQNLRPEDRGGLQDSMERGVPTWAITLLIPSWAAAYLRLTLTFGSRDEASAHLIRLVISPPLPSLSVSHTHAHPGAARVWGPFL